MNPESTNEVMTHLTSGAAIVYAVEYLKAAGWCPWLTVDSKTLVRVISAGAAFGIALGVTGHYDIHAGGTFHIPPLADLVDGLWDWAKQFTTQQVLYDTVFRRPPITVTVAHTLPSSLPPSHPQP